MPDPDALPEHELIVQTSNTTTAERGQRARQAEDLLVGCRCGWKYLRAFSSRDARRAYARHLQRVAAHGADLGDGTPNRDGARAVLARRRETAAEDG